MKSTKIRKWIILPDMQCPYEDKRSLAAAEKYMAAYRWDGYLNLGDFLDFNELGSYSRGKPGAVKENVASTFAAGNKILDRHCLILRKGNKLVRIVLFQGNHDFRAVSYGQEFPHLKEMLDVEKNLRLKERGIEWVRSWERKDKLFKLGHAHFMHGHYINKHHAMKMVEHYGVSIYYGHKHDVMLHPKVTWGNGKTLEGGSLGCLCLYNQIYLKGAPTSWQQAVSTLFLQPNGNYNLYISRIFNHRFVGPDGVEYTG